VEISDTISSGLTAKSEADQSHKLQNLVSEQLAGCGFHEIMNNSLTRASYYDSSESYPPVNLVKLLNPLSNDLNSMRQTLLFGGLESIAYNANRRNTDLRLFEFGNCYSFFQDRKTPGKELSAYSEEYRLGMWLTGKRVSGSWAHADENSSVYELKAYVENVLMRMGINPRRLVADSVPDDGYRAALSLTANGKRLGTLGIVATKHLKSFNIDNDVYYAELHWKELMRAARAVKTLYRELPVFPAVRRDLALLIDKGIRFAQIEQIAYETEKKLLREVSLFDVYEGGNLEAGKKSYAVSFVLQDETRTLTEDVIDHIMAKLTKNLENKLGAIQR
jgi:phenylalanyl-tRNA synthetase beta chain